jgi:hypothetical protein
MGRIRRGHPRGDRNRRLYQPGMIRVPKRLPRRPGGSGVSWASSVESVLPASPGARRPGIEANRASAAADKLE